MSLESIKKDIQNLFHSLVHETSDEVIAYATPAIQYIEKNGGKVILTLAEGVLSGLVAGTPWATIIASLVAAAEAQGITLAEGAASIILNMAKSNLDAKAAV